MNVLDNSTVLFDPRRPEFIANPYPTYTDMRDQAPVYWCEILNSWILTRYADVEMALRDDGFSADRATPSIRYFRSCGHNAPVVESLYANWLPFSDPPRHTRLRSIVDATLSNRRTNDFLRFATDSANFLIDRFGTTGNIDLMADYATPLPTMVVAKLMGLPPGDWPQLKSWGQDLTRLLSGTIGVPDKVDRAESSMRDLVAYLGDAIKMRRSAPSEDILTFLVGAVDHGEFRSEEELMANCVLLLLAGHETTINLIGNALFTILSHPTQARRLYSEPGLLNNAVEEVLRYEAPVQAMARVVVSDITIGGTILRKGDRVIATIGAANRDESATPDPDRFDIGRRPIRHLTFGAGRHRCPGAGFGRTESRVALEVLFFRLSSLSLTTAEPEWSPSIVLRGLRALPITVDAISPSRHLVAR